MPITIMALASHRLGRFAESGQDYVDVGLPMLGGCVGCHATIAAYNAYPSRSGYIACAECVGDAGWDSVEEANRDIFGSVGTYNSLSEYRESDPIPNYCCGCGEYGHSDEDAH